MNEIYAARQAHELDKYLVIAHMLSSPGHSLKCGPISIFYLSLWNCLPQKSINRGADGHLVILAPFIGPAGSRE